MAIKPSSFKEIEAKLKFLTPILWIRTDEENRLIAELHEKLHEKNDIHIWKGSLGMMTSKQFVQEWKDPEYEAARQNDTRGIHDAFIKINKEKPLKNMTYYLILDAEEAVKDPMVQRRILDFAGQVERYTDLLKCLIFVSHTVTIPPKLQPFVEVLSLGLPGEEDIALIVKNVVEGNDTVKMTKEERDFMTWASELHTVQSSKEKDKAKKLADVKAKKPQLPESFKAFGGLTYFQTQFLSFASFGEHQRLDTAKISDYKKQVVNKTDLITLLEPNISFSDVGGLQNLKNWLNTVKAAYTPEGRAFGLPNLKGLLMVGLPGAGKTLTAKATAAEFGLPLIHFEPSKVFSGMVGSSEANMMKAINIIEQLSPCVLFIDEIEKGLAGSQSSTFSDGGTTSRVIGLFLQWLQEHDKAIFTIATANQIHYLPPELLSRFDEIFFVELPDATSRASIVEIHLKKYGKDAKKLGIDVARLASDEVSKDLVGREIDQGIKEGLYDAFQAMRAGKSDDITTDILEKALRRKIPVVKTMQEQLAALTEWVGYDEEKGEGIRARFAGSNTKRHKEVLTAIEDGKIVTADFGKGKKK